MTASTTPPTTRPTAADVTNATASNLSDRVLTGPFAVVGYVLATIVVVTGCAIFGWKFEVLAITGMLAACIVLAGNVHEATRQVSGPALARVPRQN